MKLNGSTILTSHNTEWWDLSTCYFSNMHNLHTNEKWTKANQYEY